MGQPLFWQDSDKRLHLDATASHPPFPFAAFPDKRCYSTHNDEPSVHPCWGYGSILPPTTQGHRTYRYYEPAVIEALEKL
jgi:hypothetical protein